MQCYDELMKSLTILKPSTLEALGSDQMLEPVVVGGAPEDSEAGFEGSLQETDSGHAHTRWIVDDELDPPDLVERIHQTLQERCRRVAPAPEPKQVVVAGAGPGGLTAAIECAGRGHKVTVLEKHGTPIRLRCVGLFRQEERFLSSLGAPRSLRSEIPASYADKSNIWLFDLIYFLRLVALKLGVVIYENCTATLENGRVIGRRTGTSEMIRRRGREVDEVLPELLLPCDVVVDASGGNSSLRSTLVGEDNVVCLSDKARYALERDSDFQSYLEGQESELRTLDARLQGFPGEWERFVSLVLSKDPEIYDDPVCLVCSLERDIFRFTELPDLYKVGLVPPDWVFAPTSYGDKMDDNRWHGLDEEQIRRVHFEGMFSREAAKIGKPTWEIVETLLEAMGLKEEIDRQALSRFLSEQNTSPYSAHNTISFFHSHLTGVRTVSGKPTSWGTWEGKEYFLIGDAFQSAWYRFGVGLHDACGGGHMVGDALQTRDRDEVVRAHEKEMLRRAVQSQYALYLNERQVSQHQVIKQALGRLVEPQEEGSARRYDGWHPKETVEGVSL